jgi:hypothetical protein
MPEVSIASDTINEESAKFPQLSLSRSVFLNSLPKSGSHLLRNILRMFVPVDQVYGPQFVQFPNLQQHLAAFDENKNYLISGHLLFSDHTAILANRTNKILLVRDPYSWVLAQARFFVSDIVSSNFEHIKSGALTVDDLIGLMIFGMYKKSPPMLQQYELYVVGWLAADTHMIRYEDLVANIASIDTDAARSYFSKLMSKCGISPPDDWKERVMIGADRKQSATARENINKGESLFEFPKELSAKHKQMIDFAAPGLRALLGYD